MAKGNTIKRFFNRIGKRTKRLLIVALVILTLIISIAPIFWGTVKGIFDSVGDFFGDVLDNINLSGNNLEIDQEYLSEAKKKLKQKGINPETLGLGGHEEYLERFLEAEIVTNYPYLGGDGLQGTVYFERAKIDGTTTQLKYIEYNEFYKKKNNGDDDIVNYFTIDTNDWTVHIIKSSSNEEEKSTIEKIDYKNMVSKYSMPFEFPIALVMITQNPQFALAVVNLVKESRIVVTIAESKTTTTTTTTHKYDEEIYRTWTDDEGNEQEETVSNPNQQEVKEEVEETYITNIFLSRANTWILNEITDLKYEDVTPDPGEPEIIELEDSRTETTENGVKTVTTRTNVSDSIVVQNHYQRWNRGTTKVIDKTSNFTNLILRESTLIGGNGLVEIAKRCHDAVADAGFTYGPTSGGIPVDVTTDNKIDCSGYVSWVLYEAGYKEMEGGQHTTSNSSLGAFGKEKGWEIIENVEDLQPGDICFYRGSINGDDPGHVNICVGKEEGKYIFYDCGWDGAIKAKDPITYDMDEFGYAFRPNDDIVKALNPESIDDLREKIENYISGIEEGKYSVSVRDLNNSSESININNDKIRSEGLIKLYIMATAYNEVKKGNITEETIAADVERMITADSDDAANALLKTIGKDDINEGISLVSKYLSSNSYTKTKIGEQLSNIEGAPGSDETYTSVSDATLIMKKIFEGKCVNKEYSEKMLNYLKSQLITDLIPSVIENGEIANKTGEQKESIQDVAIVSIEKANYSIAVMAEGVENKEEATKHIKEISRIVYTYFLENGNVNDNTSNFEEDEEINTIMNGRRVCYEMPNGGYQCPLNNLIEGREMLFELLASDDKTQNHERLMRYILYLLTGKDYGVTEFDFQEFLNGSFVGAGGAWSAVWNNACTKEEFVAAVKAFSPPNVTGNGGRSAVDCYNKYFVANAENFYDICTGNGMDPRFIFCIGIHESYYGTSNIANEKGNFFGWGAYDWDPGGSAITFADMSEGIQDVSSGLKNYVTPGTWQYERIKSNGYEPTTIEGIGSLYASDPNWANAVKQHMTNIFGCTGGTSLEDATEMQRKIVEIASSQDTLGNSAGWCQSWVADVYEKVGQSRISSCCASTAADKWVVSQDKESIPLGACVYGHSYNYEAQCGGREAGHVGIYIGDGKVASNVGGIRIESLDSWISSFGWKGWGWNGGTDYSRL